MKHTPEEWIIIESGYQERPDELLIESPREGKSNKRICEMGYNGVKKSQEDKANACLIIAAPKLLKAGIALFKAAREGKQNIPIHLVPAWGMLFEAIVKAKGDDKNYTEDDRGNFHEVQITPAGLKNFVKGIEGE